MGGRNILRPYHISDSHLSASFLLITRKPDTLIPLVSRPQPAIASDQSQAEAETWVAGTSCARTIFLTHIFLPPSF